MAPWRRKIWRKRSRRAGSHTLTLTPFVDLPAFLDIQGALPLAQRSEQGGLRHPQKEELLNFLGVGNRAPLAMEQECDAHVVERMSELLIDFLSGSRHSRRPLRGGRHRKS